jgi:hypothetical protein
VNHLAPLAPQFWGEQELGFDGHNSMFGGLALVDNRVGDGGNDTLPYSLLTLDSFEF